jgi:hypothetical protein
MRYFLHEQKLPEVLVSRDQHPLIDCRSLQERTITGIRMPQMIGFPEKFTGSAIIR